jgi:hypothetical protein
MWDPFHKRGLNRQVAGDDVIATPEGDNEYPPDEPVGPVDGLQTAGGNAPLAYDADKPDHAHASPQDADHPEGTDRVANERADRDDHRDDHKDHPEHPEHHHHKEGIEGEVEETVDKLSLGQILT